MPDINAWLADTEAIDEEHRAALAWRRIQDKPSSIAFKKPDGTTLSAQTVRIESDTSVSEAESASGTGPRRKVIVFGVQNHATVSDTDVAEGYRFILNNDEYRIVGLIRTLGEIQAFAEATG